MAVFSNSVVGNLKSGPPVRRCSVLLLADKSHYPGSELKHRRELVLSMVVLVSLFVGISNQSTVC
jgi:hypothetical protein